MHLFNKRPLLPDNNKRRSTIYRDIQSDNKQTSIQFPTIKIEEHILLLVFSRNLGVVTFFTETLRPTDLHFVKVPAKSLHISNELMKCFIIPEIYLLIFL